MGVPNSTSNPQYKEVIQSYNKEVTKSHAFDDAYTEDVLEAIFSNLSIKELGRAALVCKKFNKVQNRPILWKRIADLYHYKLPRDINFKLKIRDLKIKHERGEIDLLTKSITVNDKFISSTTESYEFLEKALSHFPKDHYISLTINSVFGSDPTIIYYDKDTPKTTQIFDQVKMNEYLKDKKEIQILSKRQKKDFIKNNHLTLVEGPTLYISME